MKTATEPKQAESVEILGKNERQLEAFSEENGLSLSGNDLVQIRNHFEEVGRNPTRIELEVFAQTWSEHCKHRIFGAEIKHTVDGETRTVDGIFDTYVKAVTDRIRDEKEDFVLAAFDDNAGFIKLDDEHAACMKVETHNHPSAIEPYAGANTGLGGVIRDILGAGLVARPIGSLDIFCLGDPRTDREQLPEAVIHPLGIFRGVVQGVRDYGNRMGIPTVCGAINFHENYTYNPLVFCGTIGVIPSEKISKQIRPGQKLMVAGGLTGRDGLHGATFSSDTLSEESHEEDQGSVQIGNPIEEKKLADFLLEARDRDLIEFITDCGAGGFSSAVGEMVEDTGGRVYLENVPLKEEGLDPWEIFLSESQERMVLAVDPAAIPELRKLADTYETRCVEIGEVTNSNRLKVFHDDQLLCDLDCDVLHEPPRLQIESEYTSTNTSKVQVSVDSPSDTLGELLESLHLSSRAPVIREYDFEVQGNTIHTPLAGAGGDCPQDGVALRVEDGECAVSAGVALLPDYGEINPYRMGLNTVDEAIRQVTVNGANPERTAILDNFSMGDPEEPDKLGELVETARGMAEAAETYGTPFISGKDSFYNSFELDGEKISVPMTLVVSSIGVLDDPDYVLGTSLSSTNSSLCLVGETRSEFGGSAFTRIRETSGGTVPEVHPEQFKQQYELIHECISNGQVLAAHDVSEGGLAVAVAEMAFSNQAGLNLSLETLIQDRTLTADELLFSESAGRVLLEIDNDQLQAVRDRMTDVPFSVLGETTDSHRAIQIQDGDETILNTSISELKNRWLHGLERYY